MIRLVARHAWSLLVGFWIFGTCLVLPVVGWVLLSALICWIIGRPIVAVIERRFLPAK